MSVLTKIPGYLNKALDVVGATLFVLMFLVVGLQLLTRWVLIPIFDINFIWTEALSRYLLTTITFVGAAIATRDDEHIDIKMFVKKLPDRLQIAISTGQNLLIILFFIVFVYGTYLMAIATQGRTNFPLPTRAPFTNEWPYIFAGFCGILIIIYTFIQIVQTLRNNYEIKSDVEDLRS